MQSLKQLNLLRDKNVLFPQDSQLAGELHKLQFNHKVLQNVHVLLVESAEFW